ncbi:unnamed protein product, partial [Discosporangium mesarthrocarpum]
PEWNSDTTTACPSGSLVVTDNSPAAVQARVEANKKAAAAATASSSSPSCGGGGGGGGGGVPEVIEKPHNISNKRAGSLGPGSGGFPVNGEAVSALVVPPEPSPYAPGGSGGGDASWKHKHTRKLPWASGVGAPGAPWANGAPRANAGGSGCVS